VHIESHVACGWLLANLWPSASWRQRLAITLSAVISDADGLGYLVSADLYVRWHHTIGHNVFAAVLVSGAAVALAGKPKWGWVLLLTQLGFWSHLVGDYFFAGWGVPLFWPISREEVMYRPRMGLDHPINLVLSYGAFVYFAASLWLHGRTPLALVRPALDRLLVRVFRKANLSCHICGRGTSVQCDGCGKAVCLRHAQITRRMQIRCRACAAATPANVGSTRSPE
jgi:membrane-bound metal-dependent hydrolase YbcI (DUF457 family)